MHPKTLPSFWSDLDFERYEGQELAHAQHTFQWSFTGPDLNMAGIFPCGRNFTHNTGLPLDWLQRILREFPRAFLYDEPSRMALQRHFIRDQFGMGERLMRNNMAAHIIDDLRTSPPALAREVFTCYPDLARATDRSGKPYLSPTEALAECLPSPTEALAVKPLESTPPEVDSSPAITGRNNVPRGTNLSLRPSPCQALPKGKEQEQEKEKEQEQAQAQAPGAKTEAGRGKPERPAGEVLIPSLAEVIAHGDRIGVDRATCEAFLAYHESRNWMSGRTPLAKPLALLKGYAEERRTVRKPGSSGRLDTGRTADDIRAALATEKNPDKRAALEKQLEGAR